MKINRAIPTGFALLALLLASCGGDDTEAAQPTEGSGTTTEPAEPAPEGSEGEGAAEEDPLDALYEAAKAEGAVEYWSPTDEEIVAGYVAEFEEAFPGITINHFQARSSEAVPRILAEAPQGRVSFDIGESRIAGIVPLLDQDLIVTHDDWLELFGDRFGMEEAAVKDGGRLLSRTSLAYTVAYNTNLVSEDEAPTSWEDLLDPKWKGKLLLESRGHTWAFLAPEWGEERVLEYVNAISQQDPVYVRGGTSTKEQLAAGAAPIAVGSYLYVIADAQERDGAPVAWAPISPMSVASTMTYIVKDGPNPNAAKLFAGWLASNEGLEAILKTSYDVPITHGPSPLIERLEASGVELVVEDADNFELSAETSEKVEAALGGGE